MKKKKKKLKLAFNIEGEPVEIAETSFSNYFNKRQLVEFDEKFNSLIEAKEIMAHNVLTQSGTNIWDELINRNVEGVYRKLT